MDGMKGRAITGMMPVRVRSTTAGTCLASSEGVSARLKPGRAPFDPGARYPTRWEPAECSVRAGVPVGIIRRRRVRLVVRPPDPQSGSRGSTPLRAARAVLAHLVERLPSKAGERVRVPGAVPFRGTALVPWPRFGRGARRFDSRTRSCAPVAQLVEAAALKPRICRFESGPGYHKPSKLTRWSGAMVRRRLWVRIPPEARMWL